MNLNIAQYQFKYIFRLTEEQDEVIGKGNLQGIKKNAVNKFMSIWN